MRAAFIATVLLMMASSLAVAGEPNGAPWPAQVREMKAEVARMDRRLAALDAQLDAAFAASAATRERLARLLSAIDSVERNLRFAHLVAHLKNPPIPTPEQIEARNNELADIAPAADP